MNDEKGRKRVVKSETHLDVTSRYRTKYCNAVVNVISPKPESTSAGLTDMEQLHLPPSLNLHSVPLRSQNIRFANRPEMLVAKHILHIFETDVRYQPFIPLLMIALYYQVDFKDVLWGVSSATIATLKSPATLKVKLATVLGDSFIVFRHACEPCKLFNVSNDFQWRENVVRQICAFVKRHAKAMNINGAIETKKIASEIISNALGIISNDLTVLAPLKLGRYSHKHWLVSLMEPELTLH